MNLPLGMCQQYKNENITPLRRRQDRSLFDQIYDVEDKDKDDENDAATPQTNTTTTTRETAKKGKYFLLPVRGLNYKNSPNCIFWIFLRLDLSFRFCDEVCLDGFLEPSHF